MMNENDRAAEERARRQAAELAAKREELSQEPRESPNKEGGAHAASTGIGAAAGGIAGAAAGSILGPLGVAAGAVLGAAVGGLTGRGIGETIDPRAEEAYWREQYRRRPYVGSDREYTEFEPAYRMGWEGYAQYGQRYQTFEEADEQLAREWEERHGRSVGRPWQWARPAARDAWERLAGRRSSDRDRR